MQSETATENSIRIRTVVLITPFLSRVFFSSTSVTGREVGGVRFSTFQISFKGATLNDPFTESQDPFWKKETVGVPVQSNTGSYMCHEVYVSFCEREVYQMPNLPLLYRCEIFTLLLSWNVSSPWGLARSPKCPFVRTFHFESVTSSTLSEVLFHPGPFGISFIPRYTYSSSSFLTPIS